MAKELSTHNSLKRMQLDTDRSIPDAPPLKAAANLGISESALKSWMRAAKDREGAVPTRGCINYASDEAKEIARLQRELRDAKDALEVLKKAIGILGK
ncbi:MAG: transposase [Anaerobutyricum hallii]